MNKNIVRIASIVAGVFLLGIIIRFVVVKSSSSDNITDSTPSKIVSLRESPKLKQARELLQSGEKAQAVTDLTKIIERSSGSQDAYKSLLILGDTYKNDGNYLLAKDTYLAILNEYYQYCNYSDIQNKLSELNLLVLFSKIPTPNSEIYTVAPGNSLARIAKRYSTTVELIKRANHLKDDLIIPGMRLKVQNAPFNMVVDKSQNTLTLLIGDEVVKTYRVATGKNNSTPVGSFKISDKLIDPVWYNQGAVVSPDSPENVLGTRWLGITTDIPGYGIHGTTDPESIGYQATEGCVRLKNQDVEELFDIVPVGTEITIVD